MSEKNKQKPKKMKVCWVGVEHESLELHDYFLEQTSSYGQIERTFNVADLTILSCLGNRGIREGVLRDADKRSFIPKFLRIKKLEMIRDRLQRWER